MRAQDVKRLALACGFDLAGIAPADPVADYAWYSEWVRRGFAGEMRYLTDHRGEKRVDPRLLLPSAKSVICVGKLYNGPQPHSTEFGDSERAWISRYAWGDDYHETMARGLARLAECLTREILTNQVSPLPWKICIDTAPLLERSLARRAGLGWIGKNTCLIHEGGGSWYFLGELLTSLELEPDEPAPDRCGTCVRCIESCPTAAIVPTGRDTPAWTIDSRLCISYLTIEQRGPIADADAIGKHVFGCDICQDVCPWNRRAPVTTEFEPRAFAPPLERLAALDEHGFRALFQGSPVTRARYSGFLRNVAAAMGNAGHPKFREPLERLAASDNPLVRDQARRALRQLEDGLSEVQR